MTKNVITIPAAPAGEQAAPVPRRLRVAAYCRVSTEEERQLGSFENQVEHFARLVEADESHELVRVYCDEGISGCSTRSRQGFRAMIADCEAGLIDLVVTKSISRFARNTQDSLTYTRRLREKGIGIYFEKEGINTLESSGELLLTLFSCFAQEESRSISENTAWGIRSRFQQGIGHLNAEVLFGFDKGPDGGLVINEVQAQTVRRLYALYLEGWSLGALARLLNDEGVAGVHGQPKWCATTIGRMLANEKYKGALLMQKTFTASYLTRKSVRNTGQLPQYFVADDHAPIVELQQWEAVQEETARRRAFRATHGLRGLSGGCGSPFYARLFCTDCGCKLQRIYGKGVSRAFWRCNACGRQLPDEALRAGFCLAFNELVVRRDELLVRWAQLEEAGTPLQRVRARQMTQVTAGGPLPYEVPELTRAVLQEAWLGEAGELRIVFLSGEEVLVREGSVGLA